MVRSLGVLVSMCILTMKVRVAHQLMGRWGKSDRDAASAFPEVDSADGEEGERPC